MRFANLPLLGFGLAAFVAAKEVQNYGCPVEGTTVYCYDQKWAEYRIGDLKNGDNFGCNDMHQAIPFCCNIDSMETDNPKCEFVVRLPDGPYKQSLKECKKQEMDTYACIDKTTGDIEKMPNPPIAGGTFDCSENRVPSCCAESGAMGGLIFCAQIWADDPLPLEETDPVTRKLTQ